MNSEAGKIAEAQHVDTLQSELGLSNDYMMLRGKVRPALSNSKREYRVVELFAGCGGSALGIDQACRENGFRVSMPLVIDNNPTACAVFQDNFPDARTLCGSVYDFFSHNLTDPMTVNEKVLLNEVREIDLLIGGPPCQGHSDLNNFSRRSDPKNELYSCMARAARVLRPKHVVIENVQGITHDKSGVFQRTLADLVSQGYQVETGLVDLHAIGVPQRRRRHIVLASRILKPKPLSALEAKYSVSGGRNVHWAIGDLQDIIHIDTATTPSRPSKDNAKRIDYLFDNDLYVLPYDQ